MSPRVYRKREPAPTCSPYNPPDYAVRLAEGRMGAFVDAYQRGQRFSAKTIALSHRPVPTLLDLAVSAYLQGIEDTIQTCYDQHIDLSGREEIAEHETDPRIELNAS